MLNDTFQRLDSAQQGWRLGVTAAVWFALLAALVNIDMYATDNIPYVLTPVSLLREGNVELSEFRNFRESLPEGKRYWAVQTETGLYSKFPIWTGLLAAPVFLFSAWQPPSAKDVNLDTVISWMKLGRLYAWIVCGLFSGVLVNLLRRYVSTRWALILSFFSVFGTGIWIHSASQLSNQTFPLFLISIVLFLITGKEMNHPKALLAGLAAGLATAVRPQIFFSALLPLGIFLLQRSYRRYLLSVTLGASIFLLLTLAYNAWVFGSPFVTGFASDPHATFSFPFIPGLISMLISPTCGILIYSPFFITGIAACLYNVFSKKIFSERLLSAWILTGVAGQLLLFSKWGLGGGGWSYGARYMIETAPGLAFATAQAWTLFGTRKRLKKLILILGVISVLWHLVGTIVHEAPVDKHFWDFKRDFIFLYIKHYGWPVFISNVLKQSFLFLSANLCIGYLCIRIFLSKESFGKKDG